MKPLSVVYSKEARKDLHSIFDYIQLFRPSAAESFIESVEHTIQRIAALPRSGSLPRDKRLRARGYRFVVIEEYLLFYRYSSDRLTVLRLVHGRRHYAPLLLS